MKKLLSALLVLVLLVNLTGCVLLGDDIQLELPDFEPTISGTSDVGGPDATQKTEATESEVTEPEATEPEVTQPKPTEPKPTEPKPTEPEPTEPLLDPDGTYTSKEDVALYIHLYGKLPSNFITKSQARNLGWKSGSLERYAPGKCIGGDTFQNREGLLPKKAGRTYKECDIGTLGKSSRGAKRIVFSNDGLVYYTSDHYESFTLLYGEP
ncbi:MAG: ribonuclease [Oscillospiraceae bacterium]|nr:ribonuclease [Oscillospiraceae bacterium]